MKKTIFIIFIVIFHSLSFSSSIGISKKAGSARAIRQGVYDVDFTLIIENFNLTDTVKNVQILDDIAIGLPTGASVVVQAAPSIQADNISGETNIGFGISDTKILDGTGDLLPGTVDTILYTLRFDMNGAVGSYNYSNSAIVSSSLNSPNDGLTGPFVFQDISDDGFDPDGGDGNNDPTDQNDSTRIAGLELTPVSLGVAMLASEPELVSTGVFDVEYSIIVENFSSSKLAENIQITQSINSGVPSGASVTVQSLPSVVIGNLTGFANVNFSNSDIKILRGSGTLAPNLVDTIKYTLRLDMNGVSGTDFDYTTIVIATASQSGPNDGETGPFTSNDLSTSGLDPDGVDGDNNPNNNNQTTVVTITDLTPIIVGVAKSASEPSLISPGVFDVEYKVTIENFGDEIAQNIQLRDDISIGLPTGASVSVESQPVISIGNLTGLSNSSFGVSNQNILDGLGALGVGEVDTVTYTLRLDMTGVTTTDYSYKNSVIVTSTTAGPNDGLTGPFLFQDISDEGFDPDGGDDNDDPTDQNDTTLIISQALTPLLIGISKDSSSLTTVSPGIFDVEYVLVIENFDSLQLANNIQIVDDITAGLPAGGTVSIVSTPVISVGNLGGTINTSFGVSDQKILDGLGSLGTQSVDTIKYTVRLDFSAVASSDYEYSNSATINSISGVIANDGITGPFTAVDISDSGFDPDGGDGNNDPTDQNDTTLIVINVLTPDDIGIAMSNDAPKAISSGVFDLDYVVVVENFSTTKNAENIQIIHDMSSGLPEGAIVNIQNVPVISGTNLLGSVNTNFGLNDMTILDGSASLASTLSDTIRYTLRIDLSQSTDTSFDYLSSAYISTTDAANNDGVSGPFLAIDTSYSGLDPDGVTINGDPTDANTPTMVSFLTLGVAKEVVAIRAISTSTYELDYQVFVENQSDELADNIQLVEDLSSLLPTGLNVTDISVVSLPSSSNGSLLVNSSFNGSTDNNLLLGTSDLSSNASDTISFTIQIDISAYTGSFFIYQNSTIGTASSKLTNDGVIDSNTLVIDNSTNGTSPNGLGTNPFNQSELTIIKLPPGQIAIAKGISSVNIVADQVVDVTYKLTVKNTGDFDLPNVQVVDTISNGLPDGAIASISSLPTLRGASSLSNPNPVFDGDGDVRLLIGSDSLKIGETDTIQFTLRVDVSNINGSDFSLENIAYANSTSLGPNTGVSGVYITFDISEDGFSPTDNPDDDLNDSDTNGVTVLELENIIKANGYPDIPQAFTAGINFWEIDSFSAGLYPNNTLQIFNRWGSVVYEKAPYNNDWIGTSSSNNEELSTGTYYYVLNFGDGGKPVVGYVYLNR